MNQKHYQSIYYAHVNVNFLVENVTQIKKRITISVVFKNPKEHHVCENDYIWNSATCRL